MAKKTDKSNIAHRLDRMMNAPRDIDRPMSSPTRDFARNLSSGYGDYGTTLSMRPSMKNARRGRGRRGQSGLR